MKKISQITLKIVILIFITSCVGYEPIFNTQNVKFNISDFSIEGNKVLGNKLYSKLNNLSESTENNPDVKIIDILINITKDRKESSKDSAGNILNYKIELKTEIRITNASTKKIILEQTFLSSSVYGIQKQYSENIKLENTIVENLLNKTYQEILMKLTTDN